MCLPTGVVPTKLTPRTAGCLSRTSACSFSAVTRLTTPLGRPASYSRSSRRPPVMGTGLAALSTSVLPVAMQRGSIQPKGIMAGKLKGAMPANTPSGSRKLTVSWPVATFISDSPFMSMGAPTATSIASMIFTTSPRASSRFLPSSVETRVAISSIFARSIGRHVKSTSVRFTWRPMLLAKMDEIATLVSTELGKNLDEARGEVVKIIEAIDVAVGAPMLMKGESLMNVATGHDTVSYREPLGVFAGIAPFNFPAMIPFGWMLPLCIATGNTFVLKAANPVPLTSHLLLDMLYEAGLPKGVVNMVTAEKEEAEVLLKHPAVTMLTTPLGKPAS